ALSNAEKDVLGNWTTNVDSSVEAELCELSKAPARSCAASKSLGQPLLAFDYLLVLSGGVSRCLVELRPLALRTQVSFPDKSTGVGTRKRLLDPNPSLNQMLVVGVDFVG